ncbi:peptidylprolyl isomerase [uncultured Ruminobacter sp.]|jgi:FKBP-type peptidyl-prolyl cis-trans isomerase SlyD|uniref:FKBP-type peptidyl-prolyl cis-trans isomerase n=1 Tax=uncultured Ruminobacter sp. TaxID=538947 RepID=UPI0026124101|nr:peptidylprolyl isomerase [uncultured Ruminobacter sp.]
MKITSNTVVSIDYIVTDENGQVLDTTNGQDAMEVLIGHSNIVPGLEDALMGKEKGDRVDVLVQPDRAYGIRHPELIQEIDINMFEGMELNVGDSFLADTDMGKKPIVVKEIKGNTVVVDGNHPLAGMTLKFLVDIIDVRQATDSEIEHGHVHGAHGCCHGHDHEDGHECCGKHHHDEDHECCGRHHHDDDDHDHDHECSCRHHHDHE